MSQGCLGRVTCDERLRAGVLGGGNVNEIPGSSGATARSSKTPALVRDTKL